MNVTLCSSFRNAIPYLPRYFAQVDALDHVLHAQGHKLTFVWGEGDSSDRTLTALRAATYRFRATIVDCTHGGRAFGSIEHPARFRQLASVGNKIWAAIPDNTDVVVYVESDLIWASAMLVALIAELTVYPAVAPMVMDSPPANTFYDTWAFRRNGLRFTKHWPHHPDLMNGQSLQLDSAGSCLALRWNVAQWLHFPPEDCFVGFCRLLYEKGGELWLDPTLTVFHP